MRISDWSSDVCSSDLDIADLGERGRVPVVGVERRGRVGNHVLIGGRLSYVLRERGAFLLGTLHRKALVAGALESLNLRLVVRTEPTTDTAIGVIERGLGGRNGTLGKVEQVSPERMAVKQIGRESAVERVCQYV